jgi:hypothetical protein
MDTLQSLFAVAVLSIGCTGYGGFLLAMAKADDFIEDSSQRLAFSFVLGFGIVGWLLFFPGVSGVFGSATFWVVGVLGVALFVYRRALFRRNSARPEFSRIDILLLVVLATVLALDILEGVSPPADADTLAYHFALPRDFLLEGRIEFVPRAVSGAIPMLIHMTYAAALATGGEVGLTLWTMISGWATGFLLYAVIRPYVPRCWALTLLIAFLSTPAVLYGGGSGQVEIRCAAFALACAVLVVAARRHNDYRLFALAGLCAGYFIGAKFFGLAFAGAAGLFVLFPTNGIRRALVFSGAAVFVGFQWYLWNWLHTGDPVFPVLTNMLQFPDSAIWTREFGVYFTAFMDQGELPLERSVRNWVLYPVYATFNLVEKIEGGRTGLGILMALLLPAAVAGIWRRDLRRSDFSIPLLIAFVFFTVWFFSGTAQRTRHLLPIYPLILLGIFPIAVMLVRKTKFVLPLAAGIGAAIVLQLSGQAVFSYNYVKYALSAETRTQFLFRNVPGATSADWINRELPAGAKVAFMNRQLAYLIKRPGFSMHQHIQTVIDARSTTGDDARFVRQVRRQGVTHLLLPASLYRVNQSSDDSQEFAKMIRRSVASGCLARLAVIETVGIRSRTLSQFGDRTNRSSDAVFVLTPQKCPG